MPAMMGIILLNGTIVNNAIIVLTFIKDYIKQGMSRNDAIIETIRLRLRPILMTTTSTVIGLTPLIFEWAVGLERMSPLGIVAAGGLIFGTFLTMIITPLVYTIVSK
jgi:multidrug efflux pump subunit AcrB